MPELTGMKVAVAKRIRKVEDWWFDRTRGVATESVPVPRQPKDTVGAVRDGGVYEPARVPNIREVLRALPIRNAAEYSFVDLGSGKGRVVFIAAEMPFRRVVGVEYSRALHENAEANLRSFQARKRGSATVEFVHGDASQFAFPAGKLVLFFFNPFGPVVMSGVIRNLEASLRKEPRHVIVGMLLPEQKGMVAGMEGARVVRDERRFAVIEIDRGTQGGN
jgi:SAM-dependent methyltransferase